MKVIKGLAILSFFSILFGSCFDPPEFPVTPEISFQKDGVIFRDVADENKPDSIIIYIAFKDGDGDLGLNPQNPEHFTDPYHDARYFQSNSNGDLLPVSSTVVEVSTQGGNVELMEVLDFADPNTGKLVFARTQDTPLYSRLPEYSCVDYDYRSFIIAREDTAVVDKGISVREDTLTNSGDIYYLYSDTLYLESNPNHYNIEVDFLVKQSNNTFVEFDWRKEFCATFDGRFPVLSDNDDAALDGTLKYAMESRGFKILFGGKTLKLRVQIKDRELHVSNTIETGEFTLESIRR